MSSTVLFFGGMFNIVDPVFSLQLYIWGWFLLWFLAGAAYLSWYYGAWKPYKPFWGLWDAYKAGSNAVEIFDAALIGEMVSERVAKCIFDYSKEIIPESWFDRHFGYYPTAVLTDIDFLHALVYRFGKVNMDVQIARKLEGGDWPRFPAMECSGVDVEVIVDTDNWTIRTSPQHRAIEKAAREWNEINPTDQIYSYMKFQRYLQDNKIKCPGVKKQYEVDWTRINKGFTTDMEASEYVGKTIQMSEQEYNADQIFKNRIGYLMLIGGIGLSALICIIRVIIHFIH